MIRHFISLPRRYKKAISVATDFVLLLLAFWSVLALRFETWSPALAPYAWQMLAAPLLAIPIFIRLGLYRRAVIRFMEDRVVIVVAGGVTLSVLLLAAGVALTHTPGLSRGVLAIYWLLSIVYLARMFHKPAA